MAEQQRKIPYMSSIISYPALFVNFNRAFRMALYGFCKRGFHFVYIIQLYAKSPFIFDNHRLIHVIV